MERWTFDSQETDISTLPGRRGNLYSPVEADGGERGRTWWGHTRASSVYTKAMLHPAAAAGIAAATAVPVAGAAWRILGRRRRPVPDSKELEFGLS
jgi:hypothetical protein